MPKRKREITPEIEAAFEAAMERVKLITGARTQVQLAEVLDVRQSSISDAKRRCSIPSDWLVKLLESHGVLPTWIRTGEGPQYLAAGAHAAVAGLEERLRRITEDYVALVCRVEESLDILKLTDAELQRRKAYHAGRLSADLERGKAHVDELTNMAADVAAHTH